MIGRYKVRCAPISFHSTITGETLQTGRPTAHPRDNPWTTFHQPINTPTNKFQQRPNQHNISKFEISTGTESVMLLDKNGTLLLLPTHHAIKHNELITARANIDYCTIPDIWYLRSVHPSHARKIPINTVTVGALITKLPVQRNFCRNCNDKCDNFRKQNWRRKKKWRLSHLKKIRFISDEAFLVLKF